MLRTRDLITHLNYNELVHDGYIPHIKNNILEQSHVRDIRKYPAKIYSNKSFAHFGLLMDYIIRAGLRNTLPNEFYSSGGEHCRCSLPNICEHHSIIDDVTEIMYRTVTNISDTIPLAMKITEFMDPAVPVDVINSYQKSIFSLYRSHNSHTSSISLRALKFYK